MLRRPRRIRPLRRGSWWWDTRVRARVAEGVVYDGDSGPEGYLLYDVPAVAKSPAAPAGPAANPEQGDY